MSVSASSQHSAAHSLPGWFIKYQDNAGLTILLISLMGINAVVYGSGVVPDILRPQDWGALRTILFVFFCGAGTVMPGLALRFGVGMFVGHFFRRVICAVLTVVYFVVEVWASVTERSLTTITTPADRWLMQVLHAPPVPFSPTVLAISLSLSLAVVGWGIATTPPQLEDLVTLQNKLEAKQLKAEADAKRRGTSAAGAANAVFVARQALSGRSGLSAAKPPVPISVVRPTTPDSDLSALQDDSAPEEDNDDEDEDGGSDDTTRMPPTTPPTLQRSVVRRGRQIRGATRATGTDGSQNYRFQRVVSADALMRNVIQARTPVARVATA